MGMFLGKISVETPKHTVVEKGENYEIREYPPCVVAEVSYDASTIRGGRDGGFRMLAAYIGAFGSPANTAAAAADGKGQKIAMTAPVITASSEAVAMTAPVLTSQEDGKDGKGAAMTTMQFILPAEYTIETVPKPTDERVKVKEAPARTVAAITFSGVASESLSRTKLGVLRDALREHAPGYKTVGEHVVARYNDPFTPWFLRTNEVLVPVEKIDAAANGS